MERRIMTKSTDATCLDFDVNRMIDYPDILFCSQCKSWEDLGTTKGFCKRDSHRFQYTANYRSLMPSQKGKIGVEQHSSAEFQRKNIRHYI